MSFYNQTHTVVYWRAWRRLLLCSFSFFGVGMAYAQQAPIQLEEELRVSGGDHGAWTSPLTCVGVNSRGEMLVADMDENRVLAFNEAGEFIRLIAREGGGPGEFRNLSVFSVLKDDSAIGFEMVGGTVARLHRFDSQWQYQDTVERNIILEAVEISAMGDRITGFQIDVDSQKNHMLYQTTLFNDQLQPLQVFHSQRGPRHDRKRFQDPSYWVERIADNLARTYEGIGVVHLDQQGRLYTATSNAYQIMRHADGGQREQTYQRDTRPAPMRPAYLEEMAYLMMAPVMNDPVLSQIVTPTLLRRALAQSDPPSVKPMIFAMLTMPDGTLWVVRDVNLRTGDQRADIFSANGGFLGSLTVPNHGLVTIHGNLFVPKMIFRNGKAVTIHSDQDDNLSLVRYKIQRQ